MYLDGFDGLDYPTINFIKQNIYIFQIKPQDSSSST